MKSLHEIERAAILEALEEAGWNQEAAARALRISSRGIRAKIKLYRECGFNIPTSRMFHVKRHELPNKDTTA